MERTIEIEGISEELLARLDERAAERGLDRSTYVRDLIDRETSARPAPGRLAEWLAPLRAYSEAEGMTEEEIGEFFDREVSDARKHRRSPGSERLAG
jgi:hypothetical protein